MQLRECKWMQSVTLLWPVALKSLACPLGVFPFAKVSSILGSIFR